MPVIFLVFGEPALYRQKSSTSDVVVHAVADGAQVDILQRDDAWSEVILRTPGQPTDGKRGFLISGYITQEEEIELLFAEEMPPQERPMTGLIQKILGVHVDSKFGASTTQAVSRFQTDRGLPVTGKVDKVTGEALGLTNWMRNKQRDVGSPYNETGSRSIVFQSLTQTGFFSYWVDVDYSSRDPLTLRAIRTNNPGAINRATWRHSFPGYVGLTKSDGSANENVTMIFSAPEYGVAAWRYWFWIAFGNAQKATLADIVEQYRGVGGPAAEDYFRGYSKYSHGQITRERPIRFNDNEEMFLLARAAYSHEADCWFPLFDDQFRKGIEIGMRHIARQRSDGLLRRMGRSLYEWGVYGRDLIGDRFRR